MFRRRSVAFVVGVTICIEYGRMDAIVDTVDVVVAIGISFDIVVAIGISFDIVVAIGISFDIVWRRRSASSATTRTGHSIAPAVGRSSPRT
jgi:hypothetical protein